MRNFIYFCLILLVNIPLLSQANPFPGKKEFKGANNYCKFAAYFEPQFSGRDQKRVVIGYHVGVKTLDGYMDTRILNIYQSSLPAITDRFKDNLHHCLYDTGVVKAYLYERKDPVTFVNETISKAKSWKDFRVSKFRLPEIPNKPVCLCLKQQKNDFSVVSETHKQYMESLREIEADIRHDQAKITSSQLDSITSRINSLELLLTKFRDEGSLPMGVENELQSLKEQVIKIQKNLETITEKTP